MDRTARIVFFGLLVCLTTVTIIKWDRGSSDTGMPKTPEVTAPNTEGPKTTPPILYSREVTVGQYNRVFYVDCNNKLTFAGVFVGATGHLSIGETFHSEFRPCEQQPR